jgi:hypothetical protein
VSESHEQCPTVFSAEQPNASPCPSRCLHPVKLHYHWSGLLPQRCLAEVATPLPHAIPCNVANRTKCKREHCGCVQVGNICYHTEDHGSRSGEEPSVLGLVGATTVLDVPVYITTARPCFTWNPCHPAVQVRTSRTRGPVHGPLLVNTYNHRVGSFLAK